jgi:putative membrane protein
MWNGGWHMGWMGFGWILFVALILLMSVIIMRNAPSGRMAGPGKESAEDILKRRYAAGEIGDEEYGKKLRELRK